MLSWKVISLLVIFSAVVVSEAKKGKKNDDDADVAVSDNSCLKTPFKENKIAVRLSTAIGLINPRDRKRVLERIRKSEDRKVIKNDNLVAYSFLKKYLPGSKSKANEITKNLQANGQVPPVIPVIPVNPQVIPVNPPVNGQVPPVNGQVPPVNGQVPPVNGQVPPVNPPVDDTDADADADTENVQAPPANAPANPPANAPANAPANPPAKPPANPPAKPPANPQDKPAADNCGVAKNPPNAIVERLFGSNVAADNSWPWTVLIVSVIDDKEFICAGTIINENYVATSVDCISGADTVYVFPGTNKSKFNLKKGLKAQKVIRHPQFNRQSKRNDIALIKLFNKLKFDDKIQPICLPKKGDTQLDEGTNVDIVGWGDLKKGQKRITPNLMEISAPVVSNLKCSGRLDNKQSCVGFVDPDEPVNTKIACDGDDGDPVMIRKDGKYYLKGIISQIPEKCKGPAIITKIDPFVSWIQKVIQPKKTTDTDADADN